jgi:hypothetical protein
VRRNQQFNPSPIVQEDSIIFPERTGTGWQTKPTPIARFPASQDPEGVASHVPHMDHFYDNSLQTGLMRDIAVDLELLREHLVLLGNQVRNFC